MKTSIGIIIYTILMTNSYAKENVPTDIFKSFINIAILFGCIMLIKLLSMFLDKNYERLQEIYKKHEKVLKIIGIMFVTIFFTSLLIILYVYCMDFENPLLLFGMLVLFIVFFLLVCYRQSIYEKMPPTLQKFFDFLGRVFNIFALFSNLKNLGKLSGQSSKKYKGGQGKSGGGGSKRKF